MQNPLSRAELRAAPLVVTHGPADCLQGPPPSSQQNEARSPPPGAAGAACPGHGASCSCVHGRAAAGQNPHALPPVQAVPEGRQHNMRAGRAMQLCLNKVHGCHGRCFGRDGRDSLHRTESNRRPGRGEPHMTVHAQPLTAALTPHPLVGVTGRRPALPAGAQAGQHHHGVGALGPQAFRQLLHHGQLKIQSQAVQVLCSTRLPPSKRAAVHADFSPW